MKTEGMKKELFRILNKWEEFIIFYILLQIFAVVVYYFILVGGKGEFC
ncbi:unnamed protein product, partial [marine sediment metagenome]